MKIPFTALVAAALLLAVQPAYAQAPSAPQKPAAPAPVQKKKSAKILEMALFPLEAKGVEKNVADLVTNAVHAQMKKIPDSRIITAKELDTMMGYEQKKQLAGCSDTACIVAIGGAMGVDRIVVGDIGKLGNSYLFNLKLLNVYEGRIEEVFDRRMKGAADEELLDVVPEAMAALFPAHAMVWQKVGSHAAQRNATVNKVFPWVLVGLGGGAVISGGICNALAIQDYDDWKKLPENDPKADGVRDSGKAKEITAYVLYGVGGAMIAGGLVWYLAAGRAPAVAGAEFVPLAGADVGGAVRWKW